MDKDGGRLHCKMSGGGIPLKATEETKSIHFVRGLIFVRVVVSSTQAEKQRELETLGPKRNETNGARLKMP